MHFERFLFCDFPSHVTGSDSGTVVDKTSLCIKTLGVIIFSRFIFLKRRQQKQQV